MAQHDYVIDNSTGANVRADINSVLQAIASNNSGSSAPSTTYAFQLFADTTNNVMKIRNAANNAFIELFQLDGTFTLEDGSVSTPALAFRDDLNTGIFSSAADTFNVATGGVERMELGATTIFNEDGADVDFRIEGDSNANLFYVDAGNNRIGVGIASPDQTVHIHKASAGSASSDNNSVLTLENSNHCILQMLSPNSVSNRIMFGDPDDSNSGEIQYSHSSNVMLFTINASERVRIDSSGRVGIGATSFNDAAEYLLVKNDSTAANVSIVASNDAHSSLNLGDEDDFNIQKIKSDHTDNSLQFFTNNSERIRLKSDGDIVKTVVNNQTFRMDQTSDNNKFYNLMYSRSAGSRGDCSVVAIGEGASSQGNIKIRTSGSNAGISGGVELINGNTAFSAISDIRLKNKISDITNALTNIDKIEPIKYSWKYDTDNTPHIGVSAQSVNEVYPEIIELTRSSTDESDETDYLSVLHTELIPVCIAAIKELKAKVEALEAA